MSNKLYTVTFVGDLTAAEQQQGVRQRCYGPWCPKKGLAPGESVTLSELPDCVWGSKRHQFLVDGQPYARNGPPKAAKPEKPKETPAKE